MIVEGERSGALTPGRVILDASSGNTAIAYAMLGATLGYRVKICMPQNASVERKRTLEAFGVDLVLTDAGAGSDGSIRRCREIYRRTRRDTTTPISTATRRTGWLTSRPRPSR